MCLLGVRGAASVAAAVADAGFGEDIARSCGVVLDLAAWVRDAGAQEGRVVCVVCAPDLGEQRPAGHPSAAVACEQTEQLELDWGQVLGLNRSSQTRIRLRDEASDVRSLAIEKVVGAPRVINSGGVSSAKEASCATSASSDSATRGIGNGPSYSSRYLSWTRPSTITSPL